MLDLAPEIQLRILQFSSLGDLSSLSRVHTSLRDVAEYVLYSNIHVEWTLSPARFREWWHSTFTKDGSLMHTLTTNVRKASMVEALCFKFYSAQHGFGLSDREAGPILDKLAEALEKMPKLRDLHVLCNTDGDLSERRFSKVIGDGHFRLQTLFLDRVHDFKEIVTGQSDLRLIGIYTFSFSEIASDFFHCVVPHRYSGTMPISMQDDLADAPVFVKIGGSYWCKDDLALSLRGISDENISLLNELMQAMATWVRKCIGYEMRITVRDTTINLWRLPEFVKLLALFTKQVTLCFYFSDIGDEELRPLTTDLQSCLRGDLGHAWSAIREIRLHNRHLTPIPVLFRTNSDSQWMLVSDSPWNRDSR